MKKYSGLSKKSPITLQEYFHIANIKPYRKNSVAELSLSKRVYNLLIENNCKTITELLGLSIANLFEIEDLDKSSIRSILHHVDEYFSVPEVLTNPLTITDIKNESAAFDNRNIKSVAQDIILKSCKTDREISVAAWRADGKTLASIGEYFSFSRERIRQIEKKILDNFRNSCLRQVEKLSKELQSAVGKKLFITKGEFEDFIGENKSEIIWFLMDKGDLLEEFFHYDRNADALFFKNKNYQQIDYDKLIYSMPELLTEEEYQKEVSRLIEKKFCDREFLNLKLSQIYQHTGKFFHRNVLTLYLKIDYILKEKFADGYKISNKTYYKKFIQYLHEIFNYYKPVSQKLLDGNVSFFIGMLCERGKYIHPDYVKVPEKYITLIRNYIIKSERTAITYKEIFESLKDKFAGTQITNHYFLQGLIRLHKFPYVLRKDYLTKDSNVNIANEFEWLIQNHEKIHASEIKKYFRGFDDSNISLLLQRTPEVIRIGGNYFMHASLLNLNKNDFVQIEKVLHKLCNNNTIHAKYLFESLKDDFKDFFERNKIDKAGKLFGIVKYMLDDKFDFSRPYISEKAHLLRSGKVLLLELLSGKDKVSIVELEDICAENNINFYTTTNMIIELFPEFIRVDQFYMCRPKSIKLTKKTIDTVSKVLKSVIAENEGWLVARKFKDFDLLPKLSVEWTSHLLEGAVNLAGDIKIMKNVSITPDHSAAVFVDEKIFPENDFDAFLLKILLAEHKKNPFKSRESLISWLKKKGLRRTYVPKFLVDGGHLYRDENNILVLK